MPTLELVSWSHGICQSMHGGPRGLLSSHSPAAASVLPVASKPGQATTFTALCSNLKRKTGSLSPAFPEHTFFLRVFHKSWCLPSLKELPLLVYLHGLKVDSSRCQLMLVGLKPSLPAQSFPRAFSSWLCPCQSAYGASDKCSERLCPLDKRQ